MKPIIRIFLTGLVASLLATANDREDAWGKVETALQKDQPKTVIEMLIPLEKAARADQDWDEVDKAIALRSQLQGRIAGSLAEAVRLLDAEIAESPPPLQPILRTLSAQWLFRHYQENRWRYAQRTETEGGGDDIETWSLPRILSEIDARLQAALAESEALKTTPVTDFTALLTEATLDDAIRPTMFNILSHEALSFYSLEENAAARPADSFRIEADSPAFGTLARFLAWETKAGDAPAARAVAVLQNLLTFHQNDKDPAARLHVDLERLLWAGQVAVGENSETRYQAALRRFIESHPDQVESARACQVLAQALLNEGDTLAAHQFAKQGLEQFPEHPYGKLCANLVAQLEQRELSLTCEDHWTPAGEEITLNHRNLKKVWFRLYSRPFRPAEQIEQGPRLSQSALKDLLKTAPVTAWETSVTHKDDYARQSDAVEPPSDLPTGYHFLVAAADADFSELVTATPIHLTNLALTTRRPRLGDQGGLEGVVVDAVTGSPLSGIKVDLWSQARNEPTKHFESKTDKEGFFRFPEATGHSLVVAQKDLNRAVVNTWGSSGGWQKPGPFEQVIFFTDRAIYRPGQTVHYKGIWCHADREASDYHAVADKAGEVVFLDPSDKEVSKSSFTTNQRGSFSGTFIAPEGRALGAYRLSVPGVSGATSIRIEEYKRPKFFAEIGKTEGVAALGQPVTLSGKAESYTGAAIDGATVSWRVTRQVRWPSWINWYRWDQPTGSGAEEIATGKAETGADGTFRISFKAKPDPAVPVETEPVFDFLVTATVTDRTGETRTATRLVSVAYTALRASLAAEDWLTTTEPVKVTLTTQTHDGDTRSLPGSLKLHRLQEPESCPRPDSNQGGFQNGSNGIAPNQWELGELVEEFQVTTDAETGQAVIVRELEAGAYRWVFEGEDANGLAVKAFRGIQVFDPGGKDFPTMIPFFTVAPAWSIEPGEDFQLLWGSGHEKARALVEWHRDGSLLKREWSQPGRTQQVFRFPVSAADRGGLTVLVHQVTQNRFHQLTRQLNVPWSNKSLKIRWEHLVSKLEPGTRQTWTAVIEGSQAAEMVATLYDASLDAFAKHGFNGLAGLFRNERTYFSGVQFNSQPRQGSLLIGSPSIDRFSLGNPFRTFILSLGFSPGGLPWNADGGGGGGAWGADLSSARLLKSVARPQSATLMSDGFAANAESAPTPNAASAQPPESEQTDTPVPVRTNLQETAFFEPSLTTEENGTVRMTFTMPEALTTWRFLGFAHDADLRHGLLTGETVTAKDLMVRPNPPRFLREGDELEFTVKVINQSDDPKSGTARLALADAATDEDRSAALGITKPARPFEVPAGQSRTLSWRLKVPDGSGFLRYRATAISDSLTDGEEGWLPVLSRRTLVTESQSVPIRDPGTKDFSFENLIENGRSESLENRFLHLQVVSQPAWYAVMALPSLMESPYENSEHVFSRYYANALAGHLANSDPRIRRIFDLWKKGDTLESPLLKNQDLKALVIEATPWLAEAENQSEARRRIGLLFDENHLTRELDQALNKLRERQLADGRWPWFPGGRGNDFITLHLTTGFARLRALGIDTDLTPALRALPSLDARLTRLHREILKNGDPNRSHLTPWIAHHLYTRTFFLQDRKLEAPDQAAFDFFVAQAREFWTNLSSRMSRAHLALALHRLDETKTARLITRSLKENATVTEDQGMFWNDLEGRGWSWWQAPVETQALMIEAFREIDQDPQAVEDCQVWLIKQKQVSDWKTTKATADAVYALLKGGRDLLASHDLLKVKLGGRPIDPEDVEPGTGFYQTRFVGAEVKPSLGKIELTKSDPGVAWASLHWQYLEDLGKVVADEGEELRLDKQLFVRRHSDQGEVLEPVRGALEPGDELVTRLILRNDRAMEFVHLKDSRGSGTEPTNVLSGYRWQDGFGYYEMTRDTASHFFIDRLPSGTHVFETSVRIQHRGTYQSGLAEIRNMYAPEFSAHSQSLPLTVK